MTEHEYFRPSFRRQTQEKGKRRNEQQVISHTFDYRRRIDPVLISENITVHPRPALARIQTPDRSRTGIQSCRRGQETDGKVVCRLDVTELSKTMANSVSTTVKSPVNRLPDNDPTSARR
jgi:hypothetical protein